MRDIVKVQRSIRGSPNIHPGILAYNKDRSVEWQGPMTKEVDGLMGDSFKEYFYYEVTAEGQIKLMELAPEQNW
jgi:hypothetical protein